MGWGGASRRRGRGPLAPALVVALAAALVEPVSGPARAGAAEPGSVVLSELGYHPASDDEDEELLELHNPGVDPVDLEGWCLADGVEHCFEAGDAIAAGGFLLLGSDADGFAAVYGAPPDATYDGNLSNGGERVQLLDDTAAVIDEVEYEDRHPWPTTPDGLGPSLERRDVAAPADTPRGWAASTHPDGHTAGGPNATAGVGLLPGIDVTLPASPVAPDTPSVVTAAVEGDATAVDLAYVVGFGDEQVVAMADDGAHGDGAADDGTWGAEVPGQADGSVVRVAVEATGPSATARWPRVDDTVGYHGWTVHAAGPDTELPVFEWFIPEEDYQDLVTHPHQPIEKHAVIAFAGVVHDRVVVHVRGSALGRFRDKLKWKFELAANHEIDAPDLLPEPIDELAMDSGDPDTTHAVHPVTWAGMAEAGVPAVSAFKVRLHKNDELLGVYTFLESQDGTWREREGFDEATIFEATNATFADAGSPAGLSSQFAPDHPNDADLALLYPLVQTVASAPGPERRAALRDHLDVPATIDYLAANAVLGNRDVFFKNFLLVHDTDETERWQPIPWDLDATLGLPAGSRSSTVLPEAAVVLARAVMEDPTLAEMYLRRVRTLADELLASGWAADRFAEVYEQVGDDALADYEIWQPPDLPPDEAAAEVLAYLEEREAFFLDQEQGPGLVPDAPPEEPEVVISELHYNPEGGGDLEFVELHNAEATAVDVSGWVLADGIDAELPAGSVLPAGGYAVVVADDVAFRGEAPAGTLVLGTYDGGLGNGGETIGLLDADGALVEEVTYDDGGGWPTAPDGDGPSLSRTALGGPPSDPASWAASPADGGTPGRAHDGQVAALAVAAAVTPSPAEVGTTATLQVGVQNTSDATLTGVSVAAPDGPGCTGALADLDPGQVEVATCDVTVPDEVGTAAFPVEVVADGQAPVATHAYVVAGVVPGPIEVDLSAASPTVVAGEPVEFTVEVLNPATSPVLSGEVEATLEACELDLPRLRPERTTTFGCTVPTDADDAGTTLENQVTVTPAFAGAVSSEVVAVDVVAPEPPVTFPDVPPDAYFADAVAWMVEHGITTGYGDGTFRPGNPHNRLQAAAFLHRFMEEPDADPSGFPDVPPDAFYAEAVGWMAEAGITTGYADGTFGPARTVNRAQLATFLHRLVGAPEPSQAEPFPDVPDDGYYATEAIAWMAEHGITTGYADGTFGPNRTVNRAQMAAFLFRLATTASAWDGGGVTPPSTVEL